MRSATDTEPLETARPTPEGQPVMRQSWGSLLFMHWPIDAALLRPLIPPPLEIDQRDGTAWIGVVPFTMWNIHRVGCPRFPLLHSFHELNVRTYVTLDGTPGVWFFSLDASKRIPVRAARALYHLPYYDARMSLHRDGDGVDYVSRRTHRGAPAASFRAMWRAGVDLPRSEPGSLPHFLTERYCLYAGSPSGLLRADIHHAPWPLRSATLDEWSSTMVEALGVPEPTGEPILHHADEIDVRIWKPRAVA